MTFTSIAASLTTWAVLLAGDFFGLAGFFSWTLGSGLASIIPQTADRLAARDAESRLLGADRRSLHALSIHQALRVWSARVVDDGA